MGLARLRAWIATAVLAMLSAITPSLAGDNSVEYAVKGVYLYKLLAFVDWPASVFPAPNSPIVICILGRDPFGAALDKMVVDQRIGAHPVSIRRNVTAGDVSCQVAFVDFADPQAESDALRGFGGKPVLTVTDSNAPAPGVIGFVLEKNHVRFDIDDDTATKDGLAISSKLLDLARNVKPRKAAP
jgi:hypothetical protein